MIPTLTADDIAKWNRAHDMVTRQVKLLNETLGYAEDAKHKVTFGYIGNCTPFHCALGSKGDDRSWMVFLPHPDRIGTGDDSLGSVASGDWQALFALAGQVATFRQAVSFMTSKHGMSQHETVKVRNEQAVAAKAHA